MATSATDFITASPDHQDACFRLVQYSCRLIGCVQSSQRQRSLKALANSIDSARALTRSFGILYALRALDAACRSLPRDADSALAMCCDSVLLAYHPVEIWYYALVGSDSQQSARRRLLGRLISALTFAYNVCRGARALIAMRRSCGSAEDERRLIAKLSFDSLLAAHWAIDGPAFALREWQIAVFGTVSACLGLAMQARAYGRLKDNNEQDNEHAGEQPDDERRKNE